LPVKYLAGTEKNEAARSSLLLMALVCAGASVAIALS